MIEQGVSGSKPWRERDLGEAVDACERGEAAGIIVAWQDRLFRENGRATAEVWEALVEACGRIRRKSGRGRRFRARAQLRSPCRWLPPAQSKAIRKQLPL